MAYSNLFKSGLLSESSSPLYLSEPWARDYLGPRRGSPHDDDDDDDNVQSSPMPSLPSTSQTPESLSTQDSSFYFSSNKKRRNPVEFRSFLSLDLAESQSLRSASVKGKNSFEAINSIRSRKAATSLFDSNTTMSSTAKHSPPPSSPPGSPRSLRSVTRLSYAPKPSSSTSVIVKSTSRTPSIDRTRSPLTHQPMLSLAIPAPPTRRSLSPMRFASPPHSPILASHFDADSDVSIPVSRSTTVSSTYRRVQRGDALAKLEGRRSLGAHQRVISPRPSQNFMSMSDDEDEDDLRLERKPTVVDIIIEDVMGEDAAWDEPVQTPANKENLAVTRDSAWYNRTPRASAWTLLFGDGESEHVQFPETQQEPSLRSILKSRDFKRSKRSDDSTSKMSSLSAHSTSHLHLHPLSHLSQSPPHGSGRPHSFSTRVKSHSAGASMRTRYSSGSALPTRAARSRTKSDTRPTKLELNLDFGVDWSSILRPAPPEVLNFIDLRDESQETDSRSDSWNSVFEVSCAA